MLNVLFEGAGYTTYLFGVLYLIKLSFAIVSELLKILKSHTDIQSRYGKNCWAIVTGATDGIGKGFCQALALQGINIVLISRNKEKLENVKQFLQEEQNKNNKKSEFITIQADFKYSYSNPNFFDEIVDQIQNLDIGLLINNVGVSQDKALFDLSEESIKELITINCLPIAILMKKLIPIMQARKGRSGIINLSSFAGNHPVPFMQIYSASKFIKVFDDFLSRAVGPEVETKIDLLSLRPLLVTSQMTKNQTTFVFISSLQCALGCLQRLGLTNATYGHWFHRIQGTMMDLMPNWMQRIILISETKDEFNK